MFIKFTYSGTDSVVYVNPNQVMRINVYRNDAGKEYLSLTLVDGNAVTVNEDTIYLAKAYRDSGLGEAFARG